MFDSEIAQASFRYNVPESWIRGVIQVESSWNPNAYRAELRINDASYGLMQLLTQTARGLGWKGTDPKELYQPAVNIDLGAKLLGQLRRSYGDDFRRVYSAYNSGKPDLWQTSTQVAANVQKAMDALARYTSEAVQSVMRSDATGPVAAILIVIILWAWGKRK